MEYKKYIRLQNILLLASIYCIVLLLVYKVQLSGDSQSYISAWEVFRSGRIDMWRTPVYPFFLGLLKMIFGDAHYLLVAVIIQHIMFLISIWYFYLLLKEIVNNEILSFVLTAFYAFYPCVQTYNCFVQTETFAVVGTIFFLYSTLMFYKNLNLIYGLCSFGWLFFLVFLRPSSIYLIPILFLFWLLVFIKRKFKPILFLWLGLGGSVVAGMTLLFYVVSFKKNYDLFTPSGIGIINKYCIARQACIIEPLVSCDEYRDRDFKGCVFDHNVSTMPEVFYESECAINEFGLKRFSDNVSNAISQNKYLYIKRLFVNVKRSSSDRLLGTAFPASKLLDIVTINLSFIYLLFFVYVVMLVKWMKQKEIACFSSLICTIVISHMSVIFFASPSNYSRLVLPVYPLFLIMIGQIFSLIKVSKSSDVELL